MSDVKRFRPDFRRRHGIVEYEHGDYVLYTDYAALQERVVELEEDIKKRVFVIFINNGELENIAKINITESLVNAKDLFLQLSDAMMREAELKEKIESLQGSLEAACEEVGYLLGVLSGIKSTNTNGANIYSGVDSIKYDVNEALNKHETLVMEKFK